MMSFRCTKQARGIADDEILRKAFEEDRVLITNDKDFGEKIFREQYLHRGVVLLRLDDERSPVKIEAIRLLMDRYADQLVDNYVVVTETRVRFARR